MKKKLKQVYIGLSANILHHGHINLVSSASKFGDLTVGLLTDKAILEKKGLPVLSWDQRKKIIENIKGVKKVVAQNEWDYSKNLLKLKPDIMVHGDDWKNSKSYDYKLRPKIIKVLKKLGAKLIEISHTKNISSSYVYNKMRVDMTDSITRKSLLRRILENKNFCRILETHSPLSALIAESAKKVETNGEVSEFDGFWSSSLTDSTLKGKPDIEVLELNQRLASINDILDVTSKPLIIDADTGGKPEHFEINIKTMERVGISALIIEDKKGLKKNSLLGNKVKQEQESIKDFSNKIKLGKKACVNKDLMVIARIESLILNKGLADAERRADAYLDAGSDAIMIHSKDSNPKEIFKFSNKFKKKYKDIPLVVVPTSFYRVKESQLIDNGFNMIIYANHLLRASYPAMQLVANSILKNKRTFEIEKKLLSIKEILKLIPGTT